MIAISRIEYQKYGCPNCGVEEAYNKRGISGYGTLPVKCYHCETEYVILFDGLKESKIGIDTGKIDEHGNPILEYPKLVPHPRKGIPKRSVININLKTLHQLYKSDDNSRGAHVKK